MLMLVLMLGLKHVLLLLLLLGLRREMLLGEELLIRIAPSHSTPTHSSTALEVVGLEGGKSLLLRLLLMMVVLVEALLLHRIPSLLPMHLHPHLLASCPSFESWKSGEVFILYAEL